MSRPEDRATTAAATAERWLLLIHQLPAKPAYFRVKIWRRLQGLGAVAVKNAVYALPANDQTREDFEWLLKEIVEGGGEAILCEAQLVDGLSDQEVRALFDRARDEDYDAIAKEARVLAARLDKATTEDRVETTAQLARLKNRLAQVVGIDFFGANGREAVDGLVAGIEAKLKEDEMAATDIGMDAASKAEAGLEPLIGRMWVTRRGVHVDRIACAWLIRRFIDPDARFRFVDQKGHVPRPGELRFDMFEAEFTHEGDRCSFEVLLGHAGLDDRALQTIGEIVHDIDLKDGKFGREEATGIKHLIAGIAMAHRDDEERIARGSAVFDDLYAYFRTKRG
ncbi:chromate resistance protein ChrB domain-containing protein [Virgifigura deserti]|uniref:chromate resistance protein ChrB domain-containing protein n=1 Tax=Virgifigura deserti TaxID=2268457 RepID=UPI003CCC2897